MELLLILGAGSVRLIVSRLIDNVIQRYIGTDLLS